MPHTQLHTWDCLHLLQRAKYELQAGINTEKTRQLNLYIYSVLWGNNFGSFTLLSLSALKHLNGIAFITRTPGLTTINIGTVYKMNNLL